MVIKYFDFFFAKNYIIRKYILEIYIYIFFFEI